MNNVIAVFFLFVALVVGSFLTTDDSACLITDPENAVTEIEKCSNSTSFVIVINGVKELNVDLKFPENSETVVIYSSTNTVIHGNHDFGRRTKVFTINVTFTKIVLDEQSFYIYSSA